MIGMVKGTTRQMKQVAGLPAPIASFRTNMSGNIDSLKVLVEAQQDLHGYDKPWAGGAGKNKLSFTSGKTHTENGITFLVDDDGSTKVTSNGASTGGSFFNYYTLNLPVGTYYLYALENDSVWSYSASGKFRLYVAYDGSGINFGNTLTVSDASKNVVVYIQAFANKSYNDTVKLMISEGSTAPTAWTPYENICPITGWSGANVTRCGVNVWGGEALLQSFIDANITGFTYDTTAKTLTYNAPAMDGKNILSNFKFKENTQYTLILRGSNARNYNATNLRVWYSDGTNSIVSFPQAQANVKQTCVFTSPSRKTIDRIAGVNASGTVTLYYDECGLFEGVLTADDFEPYNGNTYTIAFGDTYYGGELDVTNGVLRVTHQIYTFNGTEQWITNGVRGVALFINSLNPQIDTSFNPLFEIYKTIYRGEAPANNGEANFNYAYTAIQIHDERAMTATEYKNLLSNNNVKALFKLATPIEIQLTPQQIEQLEENNVFADCGDVSELKYQNRIITKLFSKG